MFILCWNKSQVRSANIPKQNSLKTHQFERGTEKHTPLGTLEELGQRASDDSNCMFCRIVSSNGSGGWKKSVAMFIPDVSSMLVPMYSAREFDPPKSGANGSRPPEGAKLLKESAAARGGGDREELLFVGDGWRMAGLVSNGVVSGVAFDTALFGLRLLGPRGD